MMKMITSFFLTTFVFYANADVKIYANDTSVMAFEESEGSKNIMSTLYGGSNNSGAASPASCVVKYNLKKESNTYLGSLLPFDSEIMSYSNGENTATFENVGNVMTYISGSAIDVCPMGTDFIGDYELVTVKSSGYKEYFDSLIEFNYTNALDIFKTKNKQRAINFISPYIKTALDNGYYYKKIFNDYGFFLQQAGRNKEAIDILTIVVTNTPKRTVAYINLGDAYWDIGDKKNASKNYKIYLSLMEKANGSNIPDRVMKRIGIN